LANAFTLAMPAMVSSTMVLLSAILSCVSFDILRMARPKTTARMAMTGTLSRIITVSSTEV